jgi:hypothetical protein
MGTMLYLVLVLLILNIGITWYVMYLLTYVLGQGFRLVKRLILGFVGERDKPLCPADMLLYSWDGGLDVCVDLTGPSPFAQTCIVDFVSGRAVIEAAQRKRVKYEAKCVDIGYGFLPFSFSSFGELEKDAMTLL